MDSAKEIAHDMLDAINVDGAGFLGAVAKGFISFPVSLYYLGYDFIHTEDRRENYEDKIRVARLVKSDNINKESLERIISVFMDEFSSRVDIEKVVGMVKSTTGTIIGKTLFAQLSGVNLGKILTNHAVTAFFAGATAGAVLTVDAEASRAIYVSRYLRERNPSFYYKLKYMGNLDLLYYLVEDVVRPFEVACDIHDKNQEDFDNLCKYFFGGL